MQGGEAAEQLGLHDQATIFVKKKVRRCMGLWQHKGFFDTAALQHQGDCRSTALATISHRGFYFYLCSVTCVQ